MRGGTSPRRVNASPETVRSGPICDNRGMPAEPPPPPAAPKPSRVHVTPEDLEKYGDEDAMRRESNDEWLREQAPPHHGD